MIVDFLNEASQRDYPLKPNPPALTMAGGSTIQINRKWFLDIGLTFGTITSYNYSNSVQLVRVDADGTGNVSFQFTDGNTYFRFQCVASGLFGTVIQAQVSGALSLVTVISSGSFSQSQGFGYLQLGDISFWAGQTGTWVSTAPIETARIMSFSNHAVNTIKIANAPTTVIPSTCLIPDPVQGWKILLGTRVPGSTACTASGTLTADDTVCYPGSPTDAILAGVTGTVTLPGCGHPAVFNQPFLVDGVINGCYRIVLAFDADTGNYVGQIRMDDTYPYGDFDYNDQTWTLTLEACTTAPSTEGYLPPATYSTDPVPATFSLSGDVTLNGGFYSTVSSNATANNITIELINDPEQSEVEPCNPQTVLVYPIGYNYVPAPPCSEIITTINGVGGDPATNAFSLIGGTGVTIQVMPNDPYSLLMVIDQTQFIPAPVVTAQCPESSSDTVSSEEPPTDILPLCNYFGISDGTDTPFDQYYDLLHLFTVSDTIYLDFAYQTFTIADHVIVMAADGSTLVDSSCIGTKREVTKHLAVSSSQTPLRVQVTPNCSTGIGSGWYWRMGCSSPMPDVSSIENCVFNVRISNTRILDATYILNSSATGVWSSDQDRCILKWSGGVWSLVVTNDNKSLVYQALNESGEPSIDSSEWTLSFNNMPDTAPMLQIFLNCPPVSS